MKGLFFVACFSSWSLVFASPMISDPSSEIDPRLPRIPHHEISWSSLREADSQHSFATPAYQFGVPEKVHVPDAAWLQLAFSAETTMIPEGAVLKIVSVEDGAVQYLDRASIEQWGHRSAYMNGNNLLVSLERADGLVLEDANDVIRSARFEIASVVVGEFVGGEAEFTICSDSDSRELSHDRRTGRIMPTGCTGWLINDKHHCFLSAGHCFQNRKQIVQFQVPSSLADGTVQHPRPEDQYPIDTESIQRSNPYTQGHDWMYYGVFPNSNTKLPAHKAQREFFTLHPNVSYVPEAGAMLSVTGYGVVYSPYRSKNQVQQYHKGPLARVTSTVANGKVSLWSLHHRVDTTGGNSGSAIVDEASGYAVGIHAYGGCWSGGSSSSNSGMFHGHANILAALENPRGVCSAGYD